MIKKITIVLVSIFSLNTLRADLADRSQLPKDSIYNLDKQWLDQNNKKIQLKDLAGQNVLIGMVYTKCPHACPMIVAKFNDFKKKSDQKGIKNVKFVLASFDVKRDSPQQLKSYMKKMYLDEKQWTFLSAPNDSTARELAVALGISYKALDDGEFSHSNKITLLGQGGEPLSKIENLNEDVATLLKPLL